MSSQEKFLKGINQKESDAWKELYRYFYGTLCNYTTKIVVDETVAEDIVQECFISIWNSSLHFQEMKALSVYLYRSVHNNALKYLRDKNVDNQRLQRWSKDKEIKAYSDYIFFFSHKDWLTLYTYKYCCEQL